MGCTREAGQAAGTGCCQPRVMCSNALMLPMHSCGWPWILTWRPCTRGAAVLLGTVVGIGTDGESTWKDQTHIYASTGLEHTSAVLKGFTGASHAWKGAALHTYKIRVKLLVMHAGLHGRSAEACRLRCAAGADKQACRRGDAAGWRLTDTHSFLVASTGGDG